MWLYAQKNKKSILMFLSIVLGQLRTLSDLFTKLSLVVAQGLKYAAASENGTH